MFENQSTANQEATEKQPECVSATQRACDAFAKMFYPFAAGIGICFFAGIMGILQCLFLVTIPFGIRWFRIVHLAFWPFDKQVIKEENTGDKERWSNILWLFFNWGILVVLFLWFWAAMAFTSADKQIDKVFAYAFWPFGKKIVKV